MNYPKEPCKDHPEKVWEWDGYAYICVSCILADRTSKKAS